MRGTIQWFGEFLGFMAICALAHCLVLAFVFPGYYSPLWPHHSDMLVPLHRAEYNATFSQIIWGIRPMGYTYLQLIGYAGLNGSIALVIATIFANLTVFGMLIRREIAAPLDWPFLGAFAAFVTLVFAHPYFYTFATWDCLAAASLTFFLSGFLAWQGLRDRAPRLALLVFFATALAACFTKETFALTALVVAACLARTRREAAGLCGAVAAALGAALAFNQWRGSVFVNWSAAPGSPYEMVFSPISVAKILWLYVSLGYGTGIFLAAMAAAGVFAWVAWRAGSRQWRLAVGLPLAGLAALLPTSLLPNHFFAGYSWQSALFVFSPILLVASEKVIPAGGSRGLRSRLALLVVLPALALSQFNYKPQWWNLVQEYILRNMTAGMHYFASQPGPAHPERRILVTGITWPMSWFDYDLAVKGLLHGKPARFDIVNHMRLPYGPGLISRHVSAAEVRLADYDEVWSFRDDGSAIGLVVPKTLDAAGVAVIQSRIAVITPQ